MLKWTHLLTRDWLGDVDPDEIRSTVAYMDGVVTSIPRVLGDDPAELREAAHKLEVPQPTNVATFLGADKAKEIVELLKCEKVTTKIQASIKATSESVVEASAELLGKLEPVLLTELVLPPDGDPADHRDKLQLLAHFNIQELDPILKVAREIHDAEAVQKITAILRGIEVSSAMAKLILDIGISGGAPPGAEARKLTESRAQLVKDVRAARQLTWKFYQFAQKAGKPDGRHYIDIFDKHVECVEKFVSSRLSAVDSCLEVMQQAWCSDAETLAKNIISWCPAGWELYESTLLEPANEKVVEALLSNASYPNISPGVEALKLMRKEMHGIQQAGPGCPWWSASLQQDVKHAIPHGTITVATTYGCYQVTKVLSKMENKSTRATEAAKVLKQLEGKVGEGRLCSSLVKALKKDPDGS